MMVFICGFLIGGMFGVTVVALCAVGGGDSPSVPRATSWPTRRRTARQAAAPAATVGTR